MFLRTKDDSILRVKKVAKDGGNFNIHITFDGTLKDWLKFRDEID